MCAHSYFYCDSVALFEKVEPLPPANRGLVKLWFICTKEQYIVIWKEEALYTLIKHIFMITLFGEKSKVQKSMYDVLPVYKRGEDETECSSFLTCAQRTLEGCRKAWWWLKHGDWMEGALRLRLLTVCLFILFDHWAIFSHWLVEHLIGARHYSRGWGKNKSLSGPGSLYFTGRNSK